MGSGNHRKHFCDHGSGSCNHGKSFCNFGNRFGSLRRHFGTFGSRSWDYGNRSNLPSHRPREAFWSAAAPRRFGKDAWIIPTQAIKPARATTVDGRHTLKR